MYKRLTWGKHSIFFILKFRGKTGPRLINNSWELGTVMTTFVSWAVSLNHRAPCASYVLPIVLSGKKIPESVVGELRDSRTLSFKIRIHSHLLRKWNLSCTMPLDVNHWLAHEDVYSSVSINENDLVLPYGLLFIILNYRGNLTTASSPSHSPFNGLSSFMNGLHG